MSMTRTSEPEPAVAAGEDPRRYAQLLSAVYDATMSGARAPARPRDVIGDSWQRVMNLGVDPENRGPADAVDDCATWLHLHHDAHAWHACYHAKSRELHL